MTPDRQHRRNTRFILAVIVTAFVILPPALVAGLGAWTQATRLRVSVEQQAVLLGRAIARHPDVWKYTTERLDEALLGVRDVGSQTIVVDSDGVEVTRMGPEPASPVIGEVQSIEVFGKRVGEVRTTHSLRRDMLLATRIGIVGALLGGGLAWLYLRSRRRELASTEARLADAIDAANDFAAVVREAMEAVILVDPATGQLIDFNDAACTLTGYPRAVLARKSVAELVPQWPAELDALASGADGPAVFEADVRARDCDRRVRISARRLVRRRKTYLACICSDITTLHQQRLQLEQLAHSDPLTQLPNRTLLADRMEQALARARRDGSLVAVALLDLDDFKPINDSFGHAAGDAVLVETANRLRSAVRTGDTVARLGGDEFVVMLVASESPEAVRQSVLRICEALAAPIALQGRQVAVSASIGVALQPPVAGGPEQLLRHADNAMYQAKQGKHPRVCFYDPRTLASRADTAASSN